MRSLLVVLGLCLERKGVGLLLLFLVGVLLRLLLVSCSSRGVLLQGLLGFL